MLAFSQSGHVGGVGDEVESGRGCVLSRDDSAFIR